MKSGEPIPLSVNPNGLLRSSMVARGAVVLVDDNGIQTHLPFVLYTESRMSNIPILEWISTPSNGISVAIFLMAMSSYKSQKQFNGNSPKSSGESDLQQEANLAYSDSI